MKVTTEKVSDLKKKIEVTLPIGAVQEAIDAAYGKIQKEVNLKGFRPGKVPRSVLEKHYREEAEHQAIQDLVNTSYGPALDEAKENPVSHPEIRVTCFQAGKELVYEAVFEVKPAIQIKEYKGLKLKKEKVSITDRDVEERLKGLQEQAAQLIPISARNKPQKGDYVVVDYQGFEEGKVIPKSETKDYLTPIGVGGLFPEVEKGLLEMAVGETKRMDVKLPENFGDKKLAGKRVTYEMTLKAIKEKKLPELTDDFAKDLGNFKTLEEVKGKIREEIVKGREAEATSKLHRQLLEKLTQENPFPVPEGMVQTELDHMYRRFVENLGRQKLTPEQVGVTPELFTKKNREEAILQVKGALLFETIAAAENIHVSPEEVRQRVEEMARSAKQPAGEWLRYYEEKKLLPGLTAAFREEKTLAFVLSNATIEEGEDRKK